MSLLLRDPRAKDMGGDRPDKTGLGPERTI